MAENKLIFKDSWAVRDSITESQKQQIANLYEQWADDIQKMADKYAMKTTKSAPVSQRYYEELKKQLKETSHQVSNEIYEKIKSNMYLISDAVVKDNINWLKDLGFSEKGLNAAFSFVPDNAVRAIATGQVYDSGWSLSKRIWGNNEETLKQLYEIVAGGVAKQTPIYDIAKQLENYVRPSAAKQWNLTAKDGKKIYPRQVDYNAQRLARTLVQHSYQQAFVAATEKNPFITDYIWIANGSRVCELCAERDGKHYKKDELPLDHPNGMCVMEPNIADDLVDQLTNWFNSEDGTYPEIDEFAKSFGYDASKYAKEVAKFTPEQEKYLKPYGFTPENMPKNFDEWSHKVGHDLGAEILEKMGTNWGDPHPYQKLQKYYNENLVKTNMSPDVKQKVQKVAEGGQKVKVPEFTFWQNKYLTPYGFSVDNMPKDFEAWLVNASYSDYEKMEKEAKKLGMSMTQFYNSKVGKLKYKTKLASEVSQIKEKQTIAKEIVKAQTNSVSSDISTWIGMAKTNTEKDMLAMEDLKNKVLTENERLGLKIYSGSSYVEMNDYLRKIAAGMSPQRAKESSGISRSELEAIENAKSALKKMKLDEGLVTRRGTDLGDIAGLFMQGNFSENLQSLKDLSAEELNEKFQGAVGTYAGFTSSSSIYERGFNGRLEVIFNLPPGAEAASIMRISRYGTGEGETLLNAGTKVLCRSIEESDGHMGSTIRMFLDVLVE